MIYSIANYIRRDDAKFYNVEMNNMHQFVRCDVTIDNILFK